MATFIPDDLSIGGEKENSIVDKIISKLWVQYRNKIDRYIIFLKERWIFTGILFAIYFIRVIRSGGFYVISYILGLYFLHALVKFVTPLGLPDIEDEEDDKFVELPMFDNKNDGDSKPLIRSVNEFQFWHGVTITVFLSNIFISSEIFDLPVYWPFLFGYFIFLVIITVKKHFQHQRKYGYNFFDFWKKANIKRGKN